MTLRSAHSEELKGFVSQREGKATATLQVMEWQQSESEKATMEAAHAPDIQRLSVDDSENLSSARAATS